MGVYVIIIIAYFRDSLGRRAENMVQLGHIPVFKRLDMRKMFFLNYSVSDLVHVSFFIFYFYNLIIFFRSHYT